MTNSPKDNYVKRLVVGRTGTRALIDAALIFYHASVPLAEAAVYMDNLERKINAGIPSERAESPRNEG